MEDLSQRTETTEVFANPDGTWTAEQANGPVRVQDADGVWADIDTRLERVEGGFAPASAATGLVLSDGADQTFASMREGGKVLRWQWPSTLPTPVIAGDTATYRDVVSGGDLVVRATATGFSHDIVLREAPEGPVSFPIPVLTGGPRLTEDAGGDLAISTSGGEELVTAEQPVMFDSSENAVGDPEHVAPVDATVTGNAGSAGGGVLTLRPDRGFLDDPDTEYPVTIDPTYTTTPAADTFVQSAVYTSGQQGSAELRAGSYDNGTTRTRSFLSFGSGPWQGQDIDSARLSLFNFNSPTCSGGAVRVAQITSTWSASTVSWAVQPTAAGPITNNSEANGYSGACPADDMTWDVTGIVSGWASGVARYGFRLAGATETTTTEYRKFRSNEYTTSSQRPRLSVTYNASPTVTSVTPCNVCTVDDALSVQGTRPTFKATFSPAAPANWQLQIRVLGSATNVVDTAPVGYSTGGIQAPAGALLRNTDYQYRVGGNDGQAVTWTGWAKLHTAANTAPTVPGNITVAPCEGGCSSPVSVQGTTPVFKGDISTDLDGDPLTYRVQIRLPSAATYVVDQANVAAPVSGRWSVQIPAGKLTRGTSYEYRALATDGTTSAMGAWAPFTASANTTPTLPTSALLSPCVSTCATPPTVQNRQLTFSAASSSDLDGDAISYRLQIRPPSASSNLVDLTSTAAPVSGRWSISVAAGTLNRGASYEYRLGAADAVSTNWTTWSGMATAANGAPSVPANVTLAPCANACSAPLTAANTHPDFSGDISVDLEDDPITYHLQVRVPSGATLVDGVNTAAPVNGRWSIGVPADQLEVGGSYEYRVGAADAVATTWSSWSTLHIDDAPPSTPAQVEVTPCYTSCATTVVDGTRPEFTAISNDPEGSPLTYRLQVRLVGQTTILADQSSRATPSDGKATIRLAAGVLAPGTAYQYQLSASDGHGTSSWTPWTQFSTSGDTPNGSTIAPYTTLSSDTTWTRASSPYILPGPVYVAAGVTLTLEPGVVVKYDSGGPIDVTGTIVASGTKASPIVFTSVRDDSVMGDSNADASDTTPAAGDYGQALRFHNPATLGDALARRQSVLRNVSVRYGGGDAGAGGNSCWRYNADAVVMYESQTRLLIEHSEFLDTYYNILVGDSGLDPQVGSLSVRLSRFGTTANGCAVAVAEAGEYFGNVFEGSPALGGLWSGASGIHASFSSNWFLGQMNLYVDRAAVPREQWNFEGNAFLGGWWNPFGGEPEDLTGNWWGQPVPPPGSYFTTVLPAMTQPPKWRNPGLESDPAPAPITNVAQSYGAGSGEFGQVPYGEQADPVNSLNGSFHQTITDATVPALGVDLDVTRTYNSADTAIGSLGTAWSWGYDARLAFPNSQTVSFKAPDGQGMDFIRSGSAFTPSAGVTATLTSDGNSYVLAPRGGGSYGFDAQGRMTFQKDVHNNTVSFTYDTNGHLASAANGPRSLTFAYTGDRLTLVTLPDATTIAYRYTGTTLTSVTDQAGKETQYRYTLGGRLETVTDPLDRIVLRLAYSTTTGRVTDQWDGANTDTHFAWNPTTSTATMTDPRGNDWVDKYDGSALVQRTDPEGRSWAYTRDDKYQLTQVMNPEGTVSLYDYNDAGDVTNYSGPNGPVSTKYNAEHRPVRTVNARGKITEMTYSPQGDLLTTARPPSGGSTTPTLESFTYWPSGLMKTSTDADGKTTQYDYNTSGDLLTETSPGGNLTTTTYLGGPAGMGRVQSQTAPGKPTATTYTYDALGQVLTVTDSLGRVTTTNTYDDAGRLATTKDAKQRQVTYSYDGADHLVGATSPDPDALPTVSTYDANGNLATATDAVGKTLTYTYNKANEVTGLSGPQGTWAVTRTKLGQVASTTAPDQSVTSFDYNAANQVTAVDYPGGATPDVRYTYDDNGNRATMNDTASNDTVAYSYDALDQLLSVSRGAQTFAYSYTQTGRLKTQTYPTPTPTQVAYDYTADGQLKTVTKGSTLEATYTYTPSGMPDTATIGTGAGAFVRNYDYDNADRLTDLEDIKTSTSAVVLNDHYAYDATDNPTTITHANNTQDTYTYDILDRLSGVCYNTATCAGATDFITWDYDPVGRRTSETRPAGTSTYNYNPTTGRLASTLTNGTTTNYTYNTLGQLTNDDQATYTYNGAGRTATETRAGHTTSYSYDGDGKRLSATDPASSRNFTWDPISHALLAELDGTGTLTGQYLYGLGPINRTNSSGTAAYYHLDIQGSVRALTNAAGVTTETAAYEPYGVLKSSSGTPTQPLGFAGQYTDPGGLQHLRARQYNPQIGMFTAPDPVESFGADPNYSYAAANPMVNGDPTGLWSIGGVVAGVVRVAPIVATVASAAALLVPVLAPIALPIAAGAGLVMAVDSMFKAGQTCLSGKGSCGQALLSGAASAALGFGAGKLAKGAYASYATAKLARAANTGQKWAYRGVGRNHPGYDDALKGRVNPRSPNGTATPAQHNLGNTTDSPYTSWTRDPDVARRFAGNDGVVLRVPRGEGSPYKFEWSPDVYYEQEILIRGPVCGAQIC